MSQKTQSKNMEKKIHKVSSELFQSLDSKNKQYKNLSMAIGEKPSEFLEDSMFDPKYQRALKIGSNKFQGPNERFKFFQGDQSVFAKDFIDDQSKLYHDQSSILTSKENLNYNSIDQSREDENMQSYPKYISIKKIERLLEDLSTNLKNPERYTLLVILDDLWTESKSISDNYQIFLKILELKGKILRDIGDYQRSVGVFKQARLYCNISKNFEKKLYFYKTIADTYIQMREYDNALIYVKKLLRWAWILNDVEYEIVAYDKIGMVYYYKGDLASADFFHEKAYSNTREPKNSQIRKNGENIVRKNKKNVSIYQQNSFETDSEDDFELGQFQRNYLNKRLSESQSHDELSFTSLKQKIPVPRKVNEHIRQLYVLGRVDVPQEKKYKYVSGKDTKYIYNHLSLNRNLKNFMIQQYVNHGFWAATQDQLSKIKYYHLHRNLKNHLGFINRIKKFILQIRNNIKYENILDLQNDNSIIQAPQNKKRDSLYITEESYHNDIKPIYPAGTQNDFLQESNNNLDSMTNLQSNKKLTIKTSLVPTLPRIQQNASYTVLAGLQSSKNSSARLQTVI